MENNQSNLKSEIKSQSFGYILTALGLVAGLAWNEAISSFIKALFPLDQNGVAPKFVYAIIVTIIVILVSKALLRVSNRDNK